MYRNSQFAFFSEMSKYVYMLVTDCWLLHNLCCTLSLFSSCFQRASGTDMEPLSVSWIIIEKWQHWPGFKKESPRNELNRYICLVHDLQILPMDVHETLLELIVAVTDHHYHIIHTQGSIYLIECASITSVSLIMHYFHCLGNHFFVSQAPYSVCTHRGTWFHRNL